MRRFILFIVCLLLGLGMLVAGLVIPMHLRAVDAKVLRHGGQGSRTLVQQGLELTRESKVGAAQLILAEAQQQHLPGAAELQASIANVSRQHGLWQVWGEPEPRFQSIFDSDKHGKIQELLRGIFKQ